MKRMFHFGSVLFACFSQTVYPCTVPSQFPAISSISLNSLAKGFVKPIDFLAINNSQAFILEQRGTIRQLNLAKGTHRRVLDIQARVYSRANETGLLGAVLAPDFPKKPYIYVNYTSDKPLKTQISRFTWKKNSFDPKSELKMLNFSQPYSNHNGGGMAFDKQGDLFIGVGDGGAGGDPQGHGQNLNTHLGSILRITPTEAGFSVPDDNPFKTRKGVQTRNIRAKETIYAYGLRNPWRISFDTDTELLYTADVGQGKFEEVDIIKKGGNYGWNSMEGMECYDGKRCNKEGKELPIFVYGRSLGVSVTGGYVYRSRDIASLYGSYIFADYVFGNVWGIDQKKVAKLLFKTDERISSFGQTSNGKVYALGHASGRVLQVVESANPNAANCDQ